MQTQLVNEGKKKLAWHTLKLLYCMNLFYNSLDILKHFHLSQPIFPCRGFEACTRSQGRGYVRKDFSLPPGYPSLKGAAGLEKQNYYLIRGVTKPCSDPIYNLVFPKDDPDPLRGPRFPTAEPWMEPCSIAKSICKGKIHKNI